MRLPEPIPPEPPVARFVRQNGAERARARLLLARRSEPLHASTVLAPTYELATGGSGGVGDPILLVGFERVFSFSSSFPPCAGSETIPSPSR